MCDINCMSLHRTLTEIQINLLYLLNTPLVVKLFVQNCDGFRTCTLAREYVSRVLYLGQNSE